MVNPLPPDAPGFTRRYLNLADPRLGAEAISATDDFFGPKERMLAPEISSATVWTEVIPALNLKGDLHHYLPFGGNQAYTHVRLNIYPDGGLARFRVYGQPLCDWKNCDRSILYDLAAMENGGHVVTANDQHFGLADNMLRPGRGLHMGDGWETRRRREPGNDWCIIALGRSGTIRKVEVDTSHFKGNYPDRCSLQAARVSGGTDESLISQSMLRSFIYPCCSLTPGRRAPFMPQGLIQCLAWPAEGLGAFPTEAGAKQTRQLAKTGQQAR